ncbi:MAG: MFS transporter [Candidatus Sungbacteria bacterium]|uniref:MFS transporter n=1 Tax=Candidatus Sungiibacteriota bacterium TaxID=2750080 RepID=A0A933DRP9_9BACT|nr:MFS transporter [Candidatus Sungbacteria bacterium]
MNQQAKKTFLGLSPNVIWMGVVSFLNDLSSDMIFPFIPIFLTSVLGASYAFVGVVEGVADATASILKIVSGRISDRWQRRKPLVVAGYSLSALAKPILAAATAPWHVLGVRFMDRVGKGTRDAPRDALISFSTERALYGRAFGFHRGMDTLGAALGPLAAFAILPLINQNYRLLFLFSFIASFFAVLILIFFVREIKADGTAAAAPSASATATADKPARPQVSDIRVNSFNNSSRARISSPVGLSLPFFLFLAVAAVASLGKASEAFLILKARDVGIAIALIPILYFVFSITFAVLATPFGAVADRVGKRNTYTAGLFLFAAVYLGMAFVATPQSIWFLFIAYGIYAALTEGVGRAIVASLVPPGIRATAFGIYNAATGLALLPASVAFGYLSQHFGSHVAFSYGAGLALAAAIGFLLMQRITMRNHSTPTQVT